MGNELVPKDILEGQLSADIFNDLTASDFTFFNRIQLFGGKSNCVQEGKIPANHYGIPVDGEYIDLGDEVDAVLLAFRPKALDTNCEPPVESFDPESDVFQRIQELAPVKDSGAMFGPEFLLYVPSAEMYVTFFMSSKTAKREARKMFPMLRSAITLKSKIIKNDKYVWTGPVVINCSTPLALPPVEDIESKIKQFLNPPAKTATEVADSTGREH